MRYLDISAELLFSFLKGLKKGEIPRAFVVAQPLPDDLEVKGIETLANGDIRAWCESAEFEGELEGEQILSPMIGSIDISTVFIGGGWKSTGPGANDCYFICDQVYLRMDEAEQSLRDKTCETVMVARVGKPFIDWVELRGSAHDE